jgi:hypothetical protein
MARPASQNSPISTTQIAQRLLKPLRQRLKTSMRNPSLKQTQPHVPTNTIYLLPSRHARIKFSTQAYPLITQYLCTTSSRQISRAVFNCHKAARFGCRNKCLLETKQPPGTAKHELPPARTLPAGTLMFEKFCFSQRCVAKTCHSEEDCPAPLRGLIASRGTLCETDRARERGLGVMP